MEYKSIEHILFSRNRLIVKIIYCKYQEQIPWKSIENRTPNKLFFCFKTAPYWSQLNMNFEFTSYNGTYTLYSATKVNSLAALSVRAFLPVTSHMICANKHYRIVWSNAHWAHIEHYFFQPWAGLRRYTCKYVFFVARYIDHLVYLWKHRLKCGVR